MEQVFWCVFITLVFLVGERASVSRLCADSRVRVLVVLVYVLILVFVLDGFVGVRLVLGGLV
jgi:hypothetical protein